MRKLLFILSSVLVFAIFNHAIWQKEVTIASGETVYVELAPVDPRSLMQGDYMRLRYAIESQTNVYETESRGYLVVLPDERGIARFQRLYDDKPLAAGEKLFHYQSQYQRVRIVPDSFMFQEGHAERYQNAKYGIFKFAAPDRYVLVGLADEELQAMGEE